MEGHMAASGGARRGPDRVKVARYQGYKPFYLARKYGITVEEARTIIKRTGRDRMRLNKAAKRLARTRLKDNVGQPARPNQ
jgi:hypothetical protein